ncbi:MAG TPA: TA system VapC family ribonuclease toxin [Candidatus Polarisedimenticolia bacterium]|nr:TA system VapC family ribonuclease toxin [Candidatus Polarisedimenticolia bacterium]
MYLLDVNVLIALAWDDHEHHRRAHAWFARLAGASFATCNITQSEFVRISLNPRIVGSQIGISDVFEILESFTKHPNHAFCEDGPLQTDPAWQTVTSYKQVTDTNLRLIARRHGRKFVTLDEGIQNRLRDDEKSWVDVIPE